MPHDHVEDEFSLKQFFNPFTSFKAVHFIIIIGLIVYLNVLFNGFVWDDYGYIINNVSAHTLNLQVIFGHNVNSKGVYYRPMDAFYFALIYSVAGNTAFLYHLLQIFVCIANAVLLFFLFKRFFYIPVAFIVSLIFLIHPLNAESTDFVIASGVPLSFLFGTIALLISFKKSYTRWNYFIISLSLLLSLLFKESGILFILIIFLYKYLYDRKNFLFLSLSMAAACIVYLIMRINAIGLFYSASLNYPQYHGSLMQKLINTPAVLFYYIANFFYPDRLVIDQLWTVKKISFASFYLPLIADTVFFVSLCILLIYLFRTKYKKVSLLFALWFFSGLPLLLPFIPLDLSASDRYFYFPIAGLLGILGIGLQLLFEKKHAVKKYGYVILIIIIVLLSVRTMVRNTNWHDAFTLYTHDSQVKDNFDLEDNLAGEYYTRNDLQNAIKHYQKSVELFPYEVNLYNLGYLSAQMNKKQQALNAYSRALTEPHYSVTPQKHLSTTYVNYAYLLLKVKQYRKAKKVIDMGLSEYPENTVLKEELMEVQKH